MEMQFLICMDFSQHFVETILPAMRNALPLHWHRKRGTLGPATVFFTLMRMVTGSTHGYRNVLDHLKRTVGDHFGWDDAPAASSLSEARRKLSAEQCRAVFQAVRTACISLSHSPKVSYQGFQLIAVDGTKVALPPYKKVGEAFGYHFCGNQKPAPAPQATLTALWDISNNTPFNWSLDPVRTSEQVPARALLKDLGANHLLLSDRGFPSRKFLAQMNHCEASFLARMKVGKQGCFQEIYAFAQDTTKLDEIVWLHENPQRVGEPTIQIRLLKHILPNEKVAVYATNLLNRRKYRRKALLDLYCYRWDIETAFKEMKVWHSLENLHARYAEGIHQEVAAIMTFMLLTAEMEAQARGYHNLEPEAPRSDAPAEPEYRFNRKQIAESIAYILAAGLEGPDAVRKEVDYCFRQYWRYKQKRRPGRSFKRAAKTAHAKYRRTQWNQDESESP